MMPEQQKTGALLGRFSRSARLDTDVGDADALDGYVLQPSVSQAFQAMARSMEATGQAAFTWTGPYGGGKSSAALTLAAAMGPAGDARDTAARILGAELHEELRSAFGVVDSGKRIIALTGRRAPIQDDLARALGKNSSDILSAVQRAMRSKKHDGLIIVIDEIGKYLEFATTQDGDIHLLQDLAELASRSKGRLALIGILHQSFEQYAGRLAKSTRDEWAKIQGRFQDIPLVSVVDETLELLARAVNTAPPSKVELDLAGKVGAVLRERRSGVSPRLELALAECAPLHPIVALLLGSIARHRFGQNERSVFGFLASGEPLGFTEFLADPTRNDGQLYTPDRLFDYLNANLGPAILASPEGHRFSTSLDAIDRASAKGGRIHERLAKVASLIEQFGSGTGLVGTREALFASLSDVAEDQLSKALGDLTSWAVLSHRKHTGVYAVHSGSDFDLERAMEAQRGSGGDLNIAERLAMSSVIAKRHYFESGTLRWWEIAVYQVPEFDMPKAGRAKQKFIEAHERGFNEWIENRPHEAMLILLVKPEGLTTSDLNSLGQALSARIGHKSVVIGIPSDSYLMRESAMELLALEMVQRDSPKLEGDAIARREVSARIAEVATALEHEVRQGFGNAKWYADGKRAANYDCRPLSEIASLEADLMFPDTPIIRSELLNRQKPSSSAAAALRVLLHSMVENSASARLSIEGFPAEYALYSAVLEQTGIHRADSNGGFGFFSPKDDGDGRSYVPIWNVANDVHQGASIAEIYELWSAAPYGMKPGPMPVIALAWILAHLKTVAVYDDGLFCSVIDDVFADRLLQSPEAITIRRVENNMGDDVFLSGVARLVGIEDGNKIEPLEVARGLVQNIASLPKWTQRTRSLTGLTRKVRDATLKANDPNQLLFIDLSAQELETKQRVEAVQDALSELLPAYSKMLDGLRRSLAASLGLNVGALGELRRRAASVQGVSGDLRLDAFALRLAAIGDEPSSLEVLEGLGSFLTHKPTRSWSDQDVDKAYAELSRFCRQFREAEALAQARGRGTGAEAISLVYSSLGDEPKLFTFEVSGDEVARAQGIADDIMANLSDQSQEVSLAALADVIKRLETQTNQLDEKVSA